VLPLRPLSRLGIAVAISRSGSESIRDGKMALATNVGALP
jgi:hypothetical protein